MEILFGIRQNRKNSGTVDFLTDKELCFIKTEKTNTLKYVAYVWKS